MSETEAPQQEVTVEICSKPVGMSQFDTIKQYPAPGTIDEVENSGYTREKILQIVFSIGPILMMLVVMILFQMDNSLKVHVISYFHQLAQVNSTSILLILGMGAALVIVSAPYLIFELCLGYTFNYFLAVSFAVLAKAIGESMCYFITKFVLKEYFLKIFSRNNYFKILNRAVQEHPWKISHIMRANALMPLFLINFGSGLMEMNFIQFIFPAILWGAFYSSISVYAGSQFHSISQLVNSTGVHGSSSLLIYFETSVVILSIILIIVVICLSKLYFNKLRKQMQLESKKNNVPSLYAASTAEELESYRIDDEYDNEYNKKQSDVSSFQFSSQ